MFKNRILCSLLTLMLLLSCLQTAVLPSSAAQGDSAPYSMGIFRSRELERPVLTASNDAATGKITLSWKAVSGAEKYQIWRSATGKKGTFSRISTVSGTSFTAEKTNVNQAFYYKIKAVRSEKTSDFSNTVFRTCDLPQPVISTVRMVISGKPRIQWEEIEGAEKYQIWCSSTGEPGSFRLLYTTKSTKFIHKGAAPGELYYYKVKAIHPNSKASSALSEPKSRTCTLPRPQVTVGMDRITGKVLLAWAPVEGATKYAVYCSTAKDGYYKWLCNTTRSVHIHKNGIAGKTYYYKVYAMHKTPAANSAYSTVVSGIAK